MEKDFDKKVVLKDLRNTMKLIEKLPTHKVKYGWGEIELDAIGAPIKVKLKKEYAKLIKTFFGTDHTPVKPKVRLKHLWGMEVVVTDEI